MGGHAAIKLLATKAFQQRGVSQKAPILEFRPETVTTEVVRGSVQSVDAPSRPRERGRRTRVLEFRSAVALRHDQELDLKVTHGPYGYMQNTSRTHAYLCSLGTR